MLQAIRERAQGWIAWFIVILISVPFALWGIQEYLGVGSVPVRASVNDREITDREFDQNYRQTRNSIQRRLGKAYRPELIDDALLREQVLESMIRSELLLQAASGMGVRTADSLLSDTIRQIPAFQVDGRFNQQAYERALRYQGKAPAQFEQELRSSMVSEQFTRALEGSAFITSKEMTEFVRLTQQQREVGYLVVPAKEFESQIKINADEVEGYYQEHQQEFMAPEQVQLEYLELNIDALAKKVELDEESLKAYYDRHKDEYMTKEQRRASHILITVDENAEEALVAAAQEKAEAALSRIQAGEDFAQVAKEVSQDPGSAERGGDLDYFERDMMTEAFEKAAFELKQGEISDLVRSKYGFHIIQMDDIRPPVGRPFEEARADVEVALKREEAGKKFYADADTLANRAFEDQDSLIPAAETLGLVLQSSDWVDRSGGKGVLQSPKVMRAAFSDDVLVQGLNSEVIETGPEQVVVLRVKEHKPAAVRAFESVQKEIEDLLLVQESARLAADKGNTLLDKLRSGSTPDEISTANEYQWQQAGRINRENRNTPAPVVQEAFTLQRPQEGSIQFGGTPLANGDYAVIALHSVTDGTLDALEDDKRKTTERSLQRSLAERQFSHLLQNLHDNAEINYPSER